MYILKINRTACSRYKCSLITMGVYMWKIEYVRVRLRLYLTSCLGGSSLCSLCSLCVGSDIKLHNFSVGCKAGKIK